MSFEDAIFVGRTNEIEQLNQLFDQQSPGIAVIYGRRRVGKTALIQQATKGRSALFFDGIENRPKSEQIDAFVFQIEAETKQKLAGAVPKKWREAFHRLTPYLEKHPSIIVLDEFQWMANYRKEIIADLKLIWDRYWSQIPGVRLILCGSIASFMKEKVVKSQALYGRAEVIIHLKPFKLGESQKVLADKGAAEVLEAQMLLGGIPQYLVLIKKYPSVRIAMEHLAFTENGFLTSEYDRIFVSHFGSNPEYEGIVRLLAEHPYGLLRKEIAAHLQASGGNLSERLNNLEAAGFIASYTPVDKKTNSTLIKYELTDAYLRFYFHFIEPNRSKLSQKAEGNFFERVAASSSYQSWMGRAFENVCREHAAKISKTLGFSGIDFHCGPYFRAPGSGQKGFQIDLLFVRADNVITLCEMKYSRQKIGAKVIPELAQRIELLQTRFPKKTVHSVLIVQSGVTQEVSASTVPSRVINVSELF